MAIKINKDALELGIALNQEMIEGLQKRVEREIKLIKILKHENILNYYNTILIS